MSTKRDRVLEAIEEAMEVLEYQLRRWGNARRRANQLDPERYPHLWAELEQDLQIIIEKLEDLRARALNEKDAALADQDERVDPQAPHLPPLQVRRAVDQRLFRRAKPPPDHDPDAPRPPRQRAYTRRRRTDPPPPGETGVPSTT